MMALFMSCGNSGSNGSMEGTQNENTQGNLIENEHLTATLPEGREKTSVYDCGFSATLKNEDGDGDKVGIRFEALDAKFDLKGWVDKKTAEGEITNKEDVTIGGITFQQYADKRPSMPYLYLVSCSNKRQYRFEICIFNEELEIEGSVKQLLESIKFR